MTDRIALALPASRQHLARRADLTAAGVTAWQLAQALRTGTLVRVRRGVYSPAPLPTIGKHLVSGGSPDPAYVARVRAELLSLGGDIAAGGRTAAALWGFDMLVEPAKIELAVTRERGRVKRVSTIRSGSHRVVDEEVLGLDPIRLTTPLETVVRCALTRPLREAVVIADSALRSRRVTLGELQRRVLEQRGRTGSRRLRALLDLVDPDCGSVLESLFRFLMVQHGLFPLSQVELQGRPGLIGRVDFVFERERLVVECDGRRWHDPDDARQKDRRRDNELTRAGWKVLRVTWAEVLHSPAYVVALVQDSLALAA